MEFYTVPFPFIQIICFTFSFQDYLLFGGFFLHVEWGILKWQIFLWWTKLFSFLMPLLFFFLCSKIRRKKTPLSISTNESKTDLIETLWKMHHDTRNFCKICVFTSNIFHNSNLLNTYPPPLQKKKHIKKTGRTNTDICLIKNPI